jgi:hypothetical protein
MSKKCGKELHPLYNTWYHARRSNLLCPEWKQDFWLFVESVGTKPEGCRLDRPNTGMVLMATNFRWLPIRLRISDYEDRSSYMREYRKQNPEKHKNMDLKKHFGITLDDYNLILEQQNNVCAICGKPEHIFNSRTQKTLSLSVDHCHTTGKIRGLLCSHCNHAIGKFNDDVELLQKAIEYLKK